MGRAVIPDKPGYSGHGKPPSRLVVAGLKVFVSESGSVVDYKPLCFYFFDGNGISSTADSTLTRPLTCPTIGPTSKLLLNRENDGTDGSFTQFALKEYLALMIIDNLAGNGQPKPCTFGFGGHKWVKNIC
jgi:hypothetical protein